MFSSLAVTDLLVGIILMPTYATIDFFSLLQVSFEYSCILYAINHFFRPLLFTATMHHLTIIAWERYVAVQKWMDYKLIITSVRLRKIADLGIRNRRLNGISQINVLMKAKQQESKVAKTTGLLTAAVMSSFIPVFVFGILGNVVSVFRTNEAIR